MIVLICLPGLLSSQILISLLLGDKLNSDQLEFGLDGGLAWSNFNDALFDDSRQNFHLGFYFDFKLNERLDFHTGVIVKSNMGASNITPYNLNDPNLDTLFKNGSVERKLSYFNIPIFLKYRFWNHFFFEVGPQIGLRNGAVDIFKSNDSDEELQYTRNIKDQINLFDLGVTAGLGYKLLKGKGISLGMRYYSGLMDVNSNNTIADFTNSNFYVFAGIPIGAHKAKDSPQEP